MGLRGFAPSVIGKALLDNQENARVVFVDPSLADDFWTDPDQVEAHFAELGTPNVGHFRARTQDFVETEVEFIRLKPQMALIGDVKTFENFIVPVPPTVDPSAYRAVIVWCESFDQFITAASYQ